MKFVSIEMNNWLVFRGIQEIVFPQNDHSNILIIFGENMHGKTSLLNAVRWALYGEALDRQKKTISNDKLINKDASRNGEVSFSVKLKIETEGTSYEIFRSAKVELGNLSASLTLKKEGRVQEGRVNEAIIEDLVPKQISNFLLFDGELLAEFEQLVVDDGGTQARSIQKSIEKALGLPVLTRAHAELGILQKKSSKAFQSEMRKEKNVEVLLRNLAMHEGDLDSKNTERISLEADIEENKATYSELESVLEKSSKDVSLSERKKLLDEELRNNKTVIKDLENKLKTSHSKLWREPLFGALAPHISILESNIAELSEKRRNAEYNSKQLKELERAVNSEICSQCGNTLDSGNMEKVLVKLEEIRSSSLDSGDLDQKIATLTKKLGGISFEGITTGVFVEIQNFSKLKSEKSRRNVEIDNTLFEIREQLADFDGEKASKVTAEFKMRLNEHGRMTASLMKIEDDINIISLEINSIKKNPAYQSELKNSGSENNVRLCDSLLTIFNAAIANYRDSMRNKVGERASSTFEQLTTEKQFDRLKINNSYGLDLIIEGEQVARSAGAEQIVALSLIEALNHHGRRKGPMLMDTPAGRLDKSHRKNIMDYLPTVVTQLAVFAHSGELTEDDIYFDPSKIGKKYRIKRLSAFHSELQEV